MKQELLAPAGDIEAGYAALYYGADAVYLGLQKFSARATASNFDEKNLDEFTAYAHHLGRKVYAAVNTVLQKKELPELLETLDICSRCRVDAVIIQDLGVARVVRESYPELEMHASTQMAVHNKEGALALQKLGFSRVVLARELTLPEIKEIASVPGLETEAFIHGALCYSYSGLCQFSSLENGRSANRGKCLYPCRACFTGDLGSKHVFSMKDMALKSDVLKMPVTSLKIEGRKKSALYVAAVTDYYRRILDGKGADVVCEENIRQIFSRPWCKFHFNGKNKDITDADFVGHRGLPIGKIEKIVKNGLSLKVTHKISRFDGLQIDVPGSEKPYGFSLQKLKVGDKTVISAEKGDYVEIEMPEKHPYLKPGLNVYLASSSAVKGAYDYLKPKPGEYRNLTDIDVRVEINEDEITAEAGKVRVGIKDSFAPAQDVKKTEDAIRSAFGKTGGTPFKLQRLDIHNPENLFVPVSQLNNLRRDLYARIKPEYKHGTLPQVTEITPAAFPQWIVKTDDLTCLSKLDLSRFSEVVYLIDPLAKPEDVSFIPKDKLRISLPAVCRKPKVYAKSVQKFLSSGYTKWEIANYWGLEFLPTDKLDISFDTPLYMFNPEAMQEASAMGAKSVAFALEDTLENIKDLAQNPPLKTTFVVYQNAPLFISAGCIRDNDCNHCSGGEKRYELYKDGHKYEAVSKNCQIMVFDRRPLCFAKEAPDVRADFYRMDFLYRRYTPEEVCEIAEKLMDFTDVGNINKGNINSRKI